jgi:hypothetical protein
MDHSPAELAALQADARAIADHLPHLMAEKARNANACL